MEQEIGLNNRTAEGDTHSNSISCLDCAKCIPNIVSDSENTRMNQRQLLLEMKSLLKNLFLQISLKLKLWLCVCVCVWYIVYCAHVHVFCLSHSIMSILIAFFQCNYVLGKTSMRSQNPQYLFQVAWEGILIVFWFNICIHWDMLTTSLVNIHHDTELELFSYNENF